MIRSIYFPEKGPYKEGLSEGEMQDALAEARALLWINLEKPDYTELLSILQNVFHFHPLSVDDCLSKGYQVPKIDDFGNYIFIVAHALKTPEDTLGMRFSVETSEIDLYLGRNYVVSVSHEERLPAVERIWDRLKIDERLSRNGSDFLGHAILDAVVTDYLPLLDWMDEELDALEDRVLEQPDPKTLARILDLKHSVVSLRRIISPLREVMNRLSRDEFPMIDQKCRIYYRDIYDHLVRIQDLSESIRDIVTGVLDTYLSSTSLRLNEVMKMLTIVSTIFLPLSFIAGLFGMNFVYNVDYDWRDGVPLVTGLCILVVIVMVYIYRRLKWL